MWIKERAPNKTFFVIYGACIKPHFFLCIIAKSCKIQILMFQFYLWIGSQFDNGDVSILCIPCILLFMSNTCEQPFIFYNEYISKRPLIFQNEYIQCRDGRKLIKKKHQVFFGPQEFQYLVKVYELLMSCSQCLYMPSHPHQGTEENSYR